MLVTPDERRALEERAAQRAQRAPDRARAAGRLGVQARDAHVLLACAAVREGGVQCVVGLIMHAALESRRAMHTRIPCLRA